MRGGSIVAITPTDVKRLLGLLLDRGRRLHPDRCNRREHRPARQHLFTWPRTALPRSARSPCHADPHAWRRGRAQRVAGPSRQRSSWWPRLRLFLIRRSPDPADHVFLKFAVFQADDLGRSDTVLVILGAISSCDPGVPLRQGDLLMFLQRSGPPTVPRGEAERVHRTRSRSALRDAGDSESRPTAARLAHDAAAPAFVPRVMAGQAE